MNDTILALQLLGKPSVSAAGVGIVLRTRKSLGLLAYLAIEGSTARSELAETFWGDMVEENARMNLRRELGRIKQAGLEQISQHTGGLSLPATLECDVLAFQQAVHDRDWQTALGLYRGVFLDGLEGENQSGFDEWLERIRTRLQDQYLDALQQRAGQLETENNLTEALSLCQQSLGLDELSEHRYRAVIRLQGLLGQRETAIKSFTALQTMLEDEFGLEPMPESVTLIDRIRSLQPVQTSSVAAQNSSQNPIQNPVQTMPLVGREAIWAQLESAWNAGKFIFVSGEAGLGKTRLMHDFMGSKGPYNALTGQPYDREQPYSTLVRGLRQVFERRPNLKLEPWLRYELSRLLPELGDGQPITPIRSEEEQHRLFEAIGQISYGLEKSDVALASDDLHFWDDQSLKALHHAATASIRAGGVGQMCIGFRASELPEYGQRLLNHMLETSIAELIELKPFSEVQTLDLMRQLSGSTAERFSKRLYDVAGGNPFYTLEVLRHLFDIGALEVRDGQWHTAFDADTADYRELTIPQTLKNTVLERVDRAGAGARRLLEAASLVGLEFRSDDLEGATALSDWEQLEVLEQAEAAQFIARVQNTSSSQAGSQAGFSFSHDLIRRSLRDGLSPARKELLHRKLGATAIRNSLSPDVIADHLEQAQQFTAATPYRLRIADNLRRTYDFNEALICYEKILNYSGQSRQSVPIDESQLEVQLEVLCCMGDVYCQTDRYANGKTYFDRARSLLQDRHSPDLKATVWVGVCRVARGQSDFVTMLEAGRQAVAFARKTDRRASDRTGDRTVMAVALRWLGLAEHYAGLWTDADAHLSEAHAIFVRLGDRAGTAEALRIWAIALDGLRDLERAKDLFRQSAKLHREIGDDRGLGYALMGLGWQEMNTNNDALAVKYSQEALEIFEGQNMIWERTNTLINLGHIANRQRDQARALTCFTQAFAQAKTLGSTSVLLEIIAGFAGMQLPKNPELSFGLLGYVLGHASSGAELQQFCAPMYEQAKSALTQPSNVPLSKNKVAQFSKRWQGLEPAAILQQLL
jgi:DNA-binding SARP family transcriptional activator